MARIFPPEPPSDKFGFFVWMMFDNLVCRIQSGWLYRLLRKELVLSSPVPLSSDAFSPFQKGDPEKNNHNKEIVDLFEHLRKKIVPDFALWLERKKEEMKVLDLKEEMHRRGLNMRHLGLVYNKLTLDEMKNKFLTEMVLRVAKSTFQALMRESMKNISLKNDKPYIRIALDYLNLLFANSIDSQHYWDNQIR